MNKTILLAASAALLLAGCAKSELATSAGNETANGNGEITFTTYTGRTITKSGTDLAQDFNVEAFINGGGLFFPSTKYTWASSAFTGDTTRYWPYTGNLDFYAVSPTSYTDTKSASKDLKPGTDKKFTVTKTDGTADIVAAYKSNVAKVNPVALEFGHKLTKVAFKAVGADTNKVYKIDSIVVAANSTSTYTFGASESWATSSDANDYIFLGTDTTIPAKTKSAISVGSTRYLIPNQSSVKAKVRYSIYEGPAKIDSTATAIEVDLPTTAWGINKSVVYSLTLNFTSSAAPVTFTATTTDWGADQEISIPLPPVLLSGEFSVSATKKVKFTKGNLYWNGSAWKMEAKQYDCPTDFNASHVGFFLWTKTAAASYAKSYDDGTCTASDKFFCDGSDDDHKLTVDGQSGLYALSKDEWTYLINTRAKASSLYKYGVSVAGHSNCLIIAPDGYAGTIVESYSAAEWTAAESAGLVCLPAAGYRIGSTLYYVGDNGYWSSTPSGSDSAYDLLFTGSNVDPADSGKRNIGCSVRLVCSAQ